MKQTWKNCDDTITIETIGQAVKISVMEESNYYPCRIELTKSKAIEVGKMILDMAACLNG